MEYLINTRVRFIHNNHTEDGVIVQKKEDIGNAFYVLRNDNGRHGHSVFPHLVHESQILGEINDELDEQLRIANKSW